ncbi:hypothetical protein I350_02520, partial [Cryptococcus amylolentus CBS 6273]
ALAIISLLLLALLIFFYSKHRLAFPPFNQKRCAVCKHGVPKSQKVDEDYFKNDGGKGWICRKCQEEREEEELEEEMEREGLGSGEKSKGKSEGGRSKGRRDEEGESKREKEGKGGKRGEREERGEKGRGQREAKNSRVEREENVDLQSPPPKNDRRPSKAREEKSRKAKVESDSESDY